MTVKGAIASTHPNEIHVTDETDQVLVDLMWESRGEWYIISRVTLTHNPEYQTPAINITAPNPGIRFTVSDQDGNTLYTNVKPKE